MIESLILNEMIYYSHVNEDNEVERQLLKSSNCSTVVGVAGSGERILALMDNSTSANFHVVDVNEEALFMLELKLAALEILSVEEYWKFCGHHDTKEEIRKEWFEQLRPKLSHSCQVYWNKNILAVKKGIVHSGHFEKFLKRVRPSVNFFLGKNFQSLFSENPSRKNRFPRKKWKLITTLFSMRWIYKALGNGDIAFISKDCSIAQIPEALNTVIIRDEASSNFMAHLIFNGHLRHLRDESIPPSLQRDILQRIKEKLTTGNLHLHLHHTDILNFITHEHPGLESKVFYSLSDILSFESFDYLEELLTKTFKPGNFTVWRTFLRNRLDKDYIGMLKTNYENLREHTDLESTRMYQVFSICKNGEGI